MGLGGIDSGGGHIGEAASVRTANTLSSIGSTAFNVAMSGATVAAGMFGGPAGSAAVSGLRSMAGSVGGGGTAGGGSGGTQDAAINRGVNAAQGSANQSANAAASEAETASANQMNLFRLQQAINNQSQSFNTLTNIAKNKHDTAMAAIQNTK